MFRARGGAYDAHMNNTMLRSMLGVFVFGFLSLSALGQAQTENVSLQTELLKDWTGLKDTMHKIAAEMPPDKYSFKPTPEQQTFGERTVHVATTNVYFLSLLGGTATKPTIDPKATSKDAALKALIGQSQDQSFAVGGGTEILVWSHGTPHVGSIADLRQGDWIQLNIRAKGGSPLAQVEGTPAASVADHGAGRGTAGRPLFLYVGTVTGGQSGGQLALHVTGGNWRALRSMLGQSLDQTFSYDDGTIFLLWEGRVPTVIDPSQLKAGDRITIRVRAPRAR